MYGATGTLIVFPLLFFGIGVAVGRLGLQSEYIKYAPWAIGVIVLEETRGERSVAYATALA